MRCARPCGRGAVLALCLLASACAAGPSLIVLQDPASGRIVPCGPTPDAAGPNPSTDAARCAAAYEQQGYRRLPLVHDGGSGE
ncbi:MAG: hypothetical protein JO010_03235 [Alphaproteobacteria bacterium]|nr:hypothetical protein [Alphaproteobacteria bacterium]